MACRRRRPEGPRSASLATSRICRRKGRDARGGRWLEALTPDAKLALRMLVKNPVLSVVGGLGMAVAITITTGFFTFMTFYYSDPPLEDGDRVVTVEYIDGDNSKSTFFDYDIWRNELETVEEELESMCESMHGLSGRLERLEQERDFYKDLLEAPGGCRGISPPSPETAPTSAHPPKGEAPSG